MPDHHTPAQSAAREAARGIIQCCYKGDGLDPALLATAITKLVLAAERRGAEAEREECAAIAELKRDGPVQVHEQDWPGTIGWKIAKAIRARASEKGTEG
jgi:hypothetical protein